MKKYKLIQSYPGVEKYIKEGDIVEWYSNWELYGINQMCFTFLAKDIVENNPKFWREVKEKDYEILNYYMQDCQGISNGRPFEVVTEVRRLSDNKVFKIFDKITSDFEKDGEQVISNFILKPNEGVCVKLIKPNVQGFVSYRKLKHIEHIKKPIFTTEDGVDKNDNDTYYWVGNEKYFHGDKWKVKGPFKVEYGFSEFSAGVKTFSTKEAAEEYILMNKPCLSINELEAMNINCRGSISLNRHELKQLVKSKI